MDRLGAEARAAVASVRSRATPGGALPPHARVVLHFHPEADLRGDAVLIRILESGRYLPQFVTGTSNGGLTAMPGGARWLWESRLFDGAYDAAAAEDRPVYGALLLNGDRYGAAARFGPAYLRLRPTVLSRTTFAYPDSAWGPAHFGVPDRLGVLAEFRRAAIGDPLDHYVEAHVHGGVRVPDDVEAVVLDPSFEDDGALAAARRLGIRVERHGGYLVSPEQIDPGYRGAAIVRLASLLAVGGRLTPAVLARARVSGAHDPQDLKQVWHCLARFGRPWR
ncbi:DUF3626 domain-containing protein [Microbacterium sp. Marseille-Q6965]|uniref:DUF3626 domain-containing protein n=1 Tax=Microbacterium sp. Marseille-Q6965 TaxID=2965072 RepID=UPI0021B81167|nr:DUF3626 domain-containing protein [Microbacterium sp. Marseille-Q6965]